MHLKKVIADIAVVAALSSSLFVHAATPFVEGQIGVANVNDVDANGASLNGSIQYDSSATYGVEFGFKDVIAPNVRIGGSINTMKFDAKGGIIDGVSVTAAEAVAQGYHWDNRATLYMLNAYYDFKTDSQFTPFLGIGIGVADIKYAKNGEFAVSLSAGAKYNIDKNLYVGAKAAYTHVNGPKDDFAVQYSGLNLYSANVSLGYEF
jgi:opacity protein-like surface antigen